MQKDLNRILCGEILTGYPRRRSDRLVLQPLQMVEQSRIREMEPRRQKKRGSIDQQWRMFVTFGQGQTGRKKGAIYSHYNERQTEYDQER
jgi:hypothetical protein